MPSSHPGELIVEPVSRQDRIDRGLAPGLTSTEKTELAAANKHIVELEAELAIHRRASELLGKVVPPKDGSRRSR